MTSAYTILVLVATAASGAAALRLLGIRYSTDRLAFTGWAWLVGCFLSATLTLLWLVALRPHFGLSIPITLLVFAGMVYWRRGLGKSTAKVAKRAGLEQRLFALTVLCLALLILDGIAISTQFPLVGGDEADIYAAKARSLYTHGLGAAFVTDAQMTVFHTFYPIFGPLLEVHCFAASGELLFFEQRLPIQAFDLALVAIMAASLRRILRPGLAAAMLVVVFTHVVFINNSGWGNMDLVVAVGIFTAVDAWDRWRIHSTAGFWRICCVALAITVWSKNEGILLGLTFAIALMLSRPRYRAFIPRGREGLWLLLPFGVFGLQAALNAGGGFDSDLFAKSADANTGLLGRLLEVTPARFSTVIEFYWHHVLATPSGGFLLLISLLLFLLHPKIAWRSPAYFPLVIVVCNLVGHALVFLATPRPLAWHLDTAAQRISFQVVPVAVLAIALVIAELAPRFAREQSASRNGQQE